MPFHRLQERRTTALQALEQVGAAEPDEPLASPGKVVRSAVSSSAVTRWLHRVIGVHNCRGRILGRWRSFTYVDHSFGEYSLAYWSFGSDSSMVNFTVFGMRVGKNDLVPSS